MTLGELIRRFQGLIQEQPETAAMPVELSEWEDEEGNLQGGGTVDGVIVVAGAVILI